MPLSDQSKWSHSNDDASTAVRKHEYGRFLEHMRMKKYTDHQHVMWLSKVPPSVAVRQCFLVTEVFVVVVAVVVVHLLFFTFGSPPHPVLSVAL